MVAPVRCEICGRVHVAGRMHGNMAVSTALQVANINGPIVSADKPRKRLTAQEAMERTKIRFEKTLAYLA